MSARLLPRLARLLRPAVAATASFARLLSGLLALRIGELRILIRLLLILLLLLLTIRRRAAQATTTALATTGLS